MKTTNLFWPFRLTALAICTLVLAGANLLSIGLPDFITRRVGLIDLAALLIMGYTTVKKLGDKPQ